MNYMFLVSPSNCSSLSRSQQEVFVILLGKIRRMRDRLSGIDEPPSRAESLANVVDVTAFGGAKPVVKLSSKTVDLLDR